MPLSYIAIATGKINYFPVLIVLALISIFANANNFSINHIKDDKGMECNALLTVILKIDLWVKNMKSLNDNIIKFLPEPVVMYDMIDELDKNLITFKRDVIRQPNINHRIYAYKIKIKYVHNASKLYFPFSDFKKMEYQCIIIYIIAG